MNVEQKLALRIARRTNRDLKVWLKTYPDPSEQELDEFIEQRHRHYLAEIADVALRLRVARRDVTVHITQELIDRSRAEGLTGTQMVAEAVKLAYRKRGVIVKAHVTLNNEITVEYAGPLENEEQP